ncbi:MAG: anthranilate synthase component I family protein [Cyclobacteriaceae bacterium]
MKLNVQQYSFLADTLTAVGLYRKIREEYKQAVLLESSDYHGNKHSYSYICFDPIATFKVEENTISVQQVGGTEEKSKIEKKEDVIEALRDFSSSFTTDENVPAMAKSVYGYSSYDSVNYFEDLDLRVTVDQNRKIPIMLYHLYRYTLLFNHFTNQLTVIEYTTGGESSQLETVVQYIKGYQGVEEENNFETTSDIYSNVTDEEYRVLVDKGIDHCLKGDVFQIVLSRRFSQGYKGDIFNVYRSLRSVNPSPYLFYFDYGDFQILGSSPEAQIIIEDNKAIIHPIAGTFKRTGNDREDYDLAKKLADDPKESSEHVMLVDLARNDLSRHGDQVEVTSFKEIQFYSHVIHMVSTVEARLEKMGASLQLYADTFPAGTLSGAPKHRAMTLIDQYEVGHRSFYGGAIGAIGFDGSINQTIMIRTLLSKDGELHYQAGAGVVAKSDRQSELQEVNNKLGALKRAIELTELH